MSYVTDDCDDLIEPKLSSSYYLLRQIIGTQMDLRLVMLLEKYQKSELEAIERWFDNMQPLALDIMGSMKIARGASKRNLHP